MCRRKNIKAVFTLEIKLSSFVRLISLYSVNPNELLVACVFDISALKSLTMQVLNNMAAFIALPSILQRILQVSS